MKCILTVFLFANEFLIKMLDLGRVEAWPQIDVGQTHVPASSQKQYNMYCSTPVCAYTIFVCADMDSIPIAN